MSLNKNDGIFRSSISGIVSGQTSQVEGVNVILDYLMGNTNYNNTKKLDKGTYTGTAKDLDNDKQDKTDNSLVSTNKTVVGAINEIIQTGSYVEITSFDTDLPLQIGYYELIDNDNNQYSIRVPSGLNINDNEVIKNVAGYVRLQGVELPCKVAIRNYPTINANTLGTIGLELESDFNNAGSTKGIKKINKNIILFEYGSNDISKLTQGSYQGTAEDLAKDIPNNLLGAESQGTIEDGTLHLIGEIWYSSANEKYYKCFEENSDDFVNALKWKEKSIRVVVDIPEDDSTKVLSAKGGKYVEDKIDSLISGGTKEASLENTTIGGIYVRWSV